MPHQDFLLQGKLGSSSVLLFLGSPLIRLCGYTRKNWIISSLLYIGVLDWVSKPR